MELPYFLEKCRVSVYNSKESRENMEEHIIILEEALI